MLIKVLVKMSYSYLASGTKIILVVLTSIEKSENGGQIRGQNFFYESMSCWVSIHRFSNMKIHNLRSNRKFKVTGGQ